MNQIDRLVMKARSKAEPPLKPWEQTMLKNPYVYRERGELLELLSTPRDDWRLIVQACVWSGGG